MTCLVVTRGGAGDILRFSSVLAADEHPVTQYGDAYCTSSDDVRRCFTMQEMAGLLRRLGDPVLAQAAGSAALSSVDRRDVQHFSDSLWRLMVSRSQDPPADPAAICEMVTDNRRKTRAAPTSYRLHPTEKERTMNDNAAQTGEVSEKTTRPVPRAPKYSDDSVISFANDKNGVAYGPDNNPKKVGSASHAVFAKYVDKMTVSAAIAAGIPRRALDWDLSHGFITIE